MYDPKFTPMYAMVELLMSSDLRSPVHDTMHDARISFRLLRASLEGCNYAHIRGLLSGSLSAWIVLQSTVLNVPGTSTCVSVSLLSTSRNAGQKFKSD